MANVYFIPGTYTGSVSWTNTALWSSGVKPATADNVFLLDGSTITIDSGLNQGTVLLASLTTSILRPKIGGNGTNYLQIGATVQVHGIPGANGVTTGGNEVKVDSGTNPTTINLISSKPVSTEGSAVPTCCFLGSNAANAFYQTGGVGSIAGLFPNESANFPTISREGGTLTVGYGATVSTVNNEGDGIFNLYAGGSGVTVNNLAGTLQTRGTFSLGAVTVRGGTCYLDHRASAGTSCGTVTLAGGTIDHSGNPAPVSYTAYVEQEGTFIEAAAGQVTKGTLSESTNNKTRKSISRS